MRKMEKQRIISLLLAICLVLGLVPVWNVEVQAAGYDGQKAAEYALTYAYSYNSNYPSYSGNDCANFVSQCLYAGGLEMDDTWYASSSYTSEAWRRCTKMNEYLISKGYTYIDNASASDVDVGDVLLYSSDGGSTYYHAMIVDGKEGNTVYVSAHTNDRRHSTGWRYDSWRLFKMSSGPSGGNSNYVPGLYTIATVTDPLNIREGIGSGYSKIGEIPKGENVTVTEVSGSWGKVTYNGVNGWISLSLCTLTAPFIGNIENGYVHIIQLAEWKHLENSNGNVQVAAGGNDSTDPKQIWYLEKQSDGLSYKITNMYDDNVLDLHDSGTENGTNVETYKSNGGANQLWYICQSGDGYNLISKCGNSLAVDVSGGIAYDGTNVHIWQRHTGNSQIYIFYKLSNDGRYYSKPEKPDAPVLSVSSTSCEPYTDVVLTWSQSAEKGEFDQRSYTITVWNTKGIIYNQGGFTDCDQTVQFAESGTFEVQITAVNDRYPDYSTASNKVEIVVSSAHTHTLVKHEKQASTCTQKGHEAYWECSGCNKLFSDVNGTQEISTVAELPLAEHKTVLKNVKTATCTESGYTGDYVCTSCGQTITKGQSIAKTGHNYDNGKVTTKATCEKDGVKTYTCANCGSTKTETIRATGHSWDSGKVTTKATCEKDGVKTYTCANCGSTKTETIRATGHSWDSGKVTTKATCEKNGIKTYTCANCGDTKTETIKATGHSYESKVVKPTCTEKGYTVHTCKNCGDSYKDTYTGATGHSWDSGKISTKATCEKDGVKTYTCANCGGTKTETIKATGHSWDSGKVTTKATCEKNGVKTYTCANCGDTKTETIKATGHSYESKVVKPTCTEKGYTLHTCKNCGDSYKDTYTGATGHSWDSGKETTKATCTKDGAKTYTCQTCGETKTEKISATGHNYESKVVKPTCTEKGYTLHSCKNCGDSYKDTYVDATSHRWDEGVVTKTPTNTEQGEKTFTCTVCGETKTESIAALGCPFTDLANPSSYYDAVLWAVSKGITKGTSATEFSPKAECTRGQIVTFLWRYAGEPEPKNTKSSFVDVTDPKASYYKAVLWAVEQGITTGTDATHFSPKDPCTRAQIVTFLWRAAGEPEPSSQQHSFEDIVEPSSYYNAVLWAVEKGITTGADSTHFNPKDTCTRAQGMTFLWRYNKTK